MLNMLNNMVVIAIFAARGFVRVVLPLASELSAFEKLAFLLARNLYQWKVKSSEEHLKYHGLVNCFSSPIHPLVRQLLAFIRVAGTSFQGETMEK